MSKYTKSTRESRESHRLFRLSKVKEIEIHNSIVRGYGFDNWSDFTQKIKYVILAMIQLGHDYKIYKNNENQYILVNSLLEQYKSTILKCACCGEKYIEFLTIDHINNNGSEHRKSIGVNKFGTGMHLHLFRNGFIASNYQILCLNCNSSLGNRGYCPHHPEVIRKTVKSELTETTDEVSMFDF